MSAEAASTLISPKPAVASVLVTPEQTPAKQAEQDLERMQSPPLTQVRQAADTRCAGRRRRRLTGVDAVRR
jgi:hypothetical protein